MEQIILEKNLGYAGTKCPRCKKGINNEVPLNGYEDIKLIQEKRYGKGTRICNECLLYFVSIKK